MAGQQGVEPWPYGFGDRCASVTPLTYELGALGRIRTCVSRFRKPEPDPLDYESKFGGATGNRTQATAVQTQRATIITMTPKKAAG